MIVIIIAFFYFLIVLPPPPPSLLFFLSALGGVPPFLPCHAILAGCLVPSPHRLPLLWLVFMCVCIHLVTWFPRGVAYLTIGSGRQVETHTHTHTVAFTRGFQLGRIANYRSLTSTGIEWDWKMPGDSGRRQQEKIEEEEEEEEERPLSIRLTRSNECNPNGWFDVADIVNESPRSVSSFPLSFHLLFVNLL